MITPPFVAPLAFVVYATLFLWDEFWGAAALLLGLFLFDRNFSYLGITIHGFSIYIVEFCILLWLIRSIITRPERWSVLRRTIPTRLKIAFVGLFFMGLISLIRGVLKYSIALALRDSMLVNYAIAIPLIVMMPIPGKGAKRFIAWMAFAAVLKSLSNIIGTFSDATLFDWMGGQPAAVALLLCLVVTFELAFADAHWLSPRRFFISLLCIIAVLLAEVRSAWLAYVAMLGTMTAIRLWAIQRPPKPALMGLANAGVLLIAGFGCVALLSQFYSGQIVSQPIMPSTTPLIPATVVTTPKTLSSAGGVSPIAANRTLVFDSEHRHAVPIQNSKQTYLTGTAMSSLKTEVPIARQMAPAPTVWEGLASEVKSFKNGVQMTNGMTRIWMWQDAIMDLTSSGPYGRIAPADLSHYSLIWLFNESTTSYLKVPVSGVGLQKLPLYIHLRQPGDPPPTIAEEAARIIQSLLGVPFGKYFLPVQVVWRVNSPNRYDPHNSFVAVLYRTGMIGFGFFLALLYLIGRAGVERLRIKDFDDSSQRLLLASLCGALLIAVHALTDNVFENSFKGLWFWILLGLVTRIAIFRYETPDRS
jgi:hypothetical protein